MRYIQCTVVTASRGRSKVALLLLRVAHAVLRLDNPLASELSLLLSHIYRLIIVALGYLAGALGDCSGCVSGVLLYLPNAAPSLRAIILHFLFPSHLVSRSGRAYQGM